MLRQRIIEKDKFKKTLTLRTYHGTTLMVKNTTLYSEEQKKVLMRLEYDINGKCISSEINGVKLI